ncbi:MAG: D-glycero-beta-D-manno-heptose-7-phosphate kinase [Candidatus Omnitrophica bacterium]|nr:D-glycero-beta-D-manno-heptose-7-phosphate kinase [Candidatus Omnitrophota bacterium]
MKELKKIIRNFANAKILVVGDLILDEYIWGSVERISPEAPVPVVWAKNNNYLPGGAANVANNIRALGAEVCLVGVVGDDAHAKTLLSELKKKGVETKGIFVERGRRTTLKTRIIAGHQQVVRLDWEHVHNICRDVKNKLLGYIYDNIREFDAVIIEDYGKGLLDRELTEEIIKEANSFKKIVTVDPKEDNFDCYFGATCITPNRKETQNAIRYLRIKDTHNKFKIYKEELFTDADIIEAGNAILEYLQLESLLITLGEQGMRLFEKGRESRYIPTVAQEVFDVSGAGDTVIATFTVALCSGASKLQAAHIANFAAGIVVGKIGTATASRKELLAGLG